jgi:carbon monoxide dehydrogenase subunit G
MEFSGRYTIPASPELVWAALNDPEILRSCIPGCETLVKSGNSDFDGAARIKIGPVSATFRGKVSLTELNPPHRLVLKGEGQGGVAGFAKGEAEVLLTPLEGATQLAYTAKANVGGKLAQIGQRLIDGAAKQIADDFFKRFSAALMPASALEPLTGATTAVSSVAPPAGAQPAESAIERRREGLAPQVWVVGLIGVIVILLVLFGVAL